MKTAATILLIILAFFVGLLTFAHHIQRLTPAKPPANADGIVVLTGASNLRIEAAMTLLRAGKGRRLLVSGVNREVSEVDIGGVTRAPKALIACCVDLGFEASDTKGNAQETAEWVALHDYRSVIVVTADYHMPRALVELRAALPGVSLTPYPVRTEGLDARHWWHTGRGARRMIIEYGKFLVISVREAVFGLGPKDSRDTQPRQVGATH